MSEGEGFIAKVCRFVDLARTAMNNCFPGDDYPPVVCLRRVLDGVVHGQQEVDDAAPESQSEAIQQLIDRIGRYDTFKSLARFTQGKMDTVIRPLLGQVDESVASRLKGDLFAVRPRADLAEIGRSISTPPEWPDIVLMYETVYEFGDVLQQLHDFTLPNDAKAEAEERRIAELNEQIAQLENQIRETDERIKTAQAEQAGFRTTNGTLKTEQTQLKKRAQELAAEVRVCQNRAADVPQFRAHLEKIAEIIYRDE
jgi:regulator of replication initiation timing